MSATPLSPDPVTGYGADTVPPYLSNGLIGLRCGPLPLLEGVCMLDGLAGIFPGDRVEGFARAPYPVAGDISAGRHPLSRRRDRFELVEQLYDFSCGELTTRFRYHAEEARLDVELLTFCSRTQPTLALQRMTVEADGPCELTLSAGVDPTGIGGRWLDRETGTPGSAQPVNDGCLRWETHGALSTAGVAYVTELKGCEPDSRTVESADELAPLRTTYKVRAEPGRRYRLEQMTSLVCSQFHQHPHRQATRLLSAARLRGFDRLREENRAAWLEIWRGRVRLTGAGEEWQRIADASFYYLQASAHASSLFSTSMFGLAYWPNYHYYRGQLMWDVETFAFPTILLTAPGTAASLLDYRSRHRADAELNAAMNGYQGLQFPWASGPLSGQEVLRTSAPLVTVEQHSTLSVAHAFAQYVHASGDDNYLAEIAWPVLEGAATWIESRAVKTRRGFEIRDTLGFAEGREGPVDNDAYVNMAATVVLREAAAFAERLGKRHRGRWAQMADRLFLPRDGDLVLNHDRFTPAEGGAVGATPEALGGLFPFGYRLDPAAERRTMEFYLGRVEPYLGSPMFSAPLGVFAARLGDRELAARLFWQGYAEFINKPWWDANEFSLVRHPERPVAGPFFANLGGFLTSVLYGLTGIQLGPDDPCRWGRRPVVLPEGWEEIEVERLWARGREYGLRARHGAERAALELS